MCKIGDFVTSYDAGFWKLMAVYPKIATENDSSSQAVWKKGDQIGQWVILKKCLTPKMKPNIRVTVVDSYWIHKVDQNTEDAILQYFEEHPAFQERFEKTDNLPPPHITNCWLNLQDHTAEEVSAALSELPNPFSEPQLRDILQAAGCKTRRKLPAEYLLNLMCYPWQVDENSNMLYHAWELIRLEDETHTH